MTELADVADCFSTLASVLKQSAAPRGACGFESRFGDIRSLR